jgi:hypothetical protein
LLLLDWDDGYLELVLWCSLTIHILAIAIWEYGPSAIWIDTIQRAFGMDTQTGVTLGCRLASAISAIGIDSCPIDAIDLIDRLLWFLTRREQSRANTGTPVILERREDLRFEWDWFSLTSNFWLLIRPRL